MFVWTRGAPHRFILFEDERAQQVKIAHDGEIHELDAPLERAGFPAGGRFERIYSSSQNDRVFTFSGVVGEPTRSGVRVERALLKTRRADGSETVRPVLGLRSCRSEMPGAPVNDG